MPVIFGPSIVEGRVYRGRRKKDEDDENQALAELQAILNAKNRRPCDCEAQLHDLLENCLNCGRLTCVAEGSGKCFSCGSLVLSQEQRDRLKNYIDINQSFPVNQQNPSSGVKIIDSQFDQFAIDTKRHLREEDKQKLKESLEELQAKRYKRKLVLTVDIEKAKAETSSVPVVENFAAEMRKLQVSEPSGSGNNNPTVVEAVETKIRDLGRKSDLRDAKEVKENNKHKRRDRNKNSQPNSSKNGDNPNKVKRNLNQGEKKPHENKPDRTPSEQKRENRRPKQPPNSSDKIK